ncbi:MAG: hypothetical protein ACOCZ8_02560 [Bacteroidota bacterium]
MLLLFPKYDWPFCLRPPASWREITLQQYTLAQRPLPGDAPFERLRWQIAVYTGVPAKQFRKLGQRQLLRISRKMAFLKTVISPESPTEIRLGNQRFSRPSSLGEMPLAQWITLEQRILSPKGKLKRIGEGELGDLPELLACLLTPPDAGFDARRIDSISAQLRKLPITTALGLRNWCFNELKQIEDTYPELFDAETTDDERYALNEQQAYFRRWGWSAILAELAGGQLLPGVREVLLQTPVAIIFQELARQQHKAEIDRQQLKALKGSKTL